MSHLKAKSVREYAEKQAQEKAAAASAEHDVVSDTVGLGFPKRERWTCQTPGCDGATLLAQPWWTDAERQAKVDEFNQKHPCKQKRDLGWRGG